MHTLISYLFIRLQTVSLAPLDTGAVVQLVLNITFVGGMRSFRVARGGLGKQPLAAFVSFGVQKKIYSLLRSKGRISLFSA